MGQEASPLLVDEFVLAVRYQQAPDVHNYVPRGKRNSVGIA